LKIFIEDKPQENEQIFGVRYTDLFSPEECDRIIRSVNPDLWQDGTHEIRSNRKVVAQASGYRSVSLQPLGNIEDQWPVEAIINAISDINEKFYRFDLSGMLFDQDTPSILKYEGARKDHYNWHIDLSGGYTTRKLTFTLQLSDPSEYEGGDLEFAPPNIVGLGPSVTPDMIRSIIKQRGGMVVFPSYMVHQVTPLLRGTRYAIVGWVHGPAFR